MLQVAIFGETVVVCVVMYPMAPSLGFLLFCIDMTMIALLGTCGLIMDVLHCFDICAKEKWKWIVFGLYVVQDLLIYAAMVLFGFYVEVEQDVIAAKLGTLAILFFFLLLATVSKFFDE